jgi:hypothetical protein
MAARKTTRESIGGAVAGHAAGWAPRRRPSGDCAVYNSGSVPARRSLARGLARCSCAPATLRLGDVRLRIGLRALSARRVPVHSISEGPENYSRFLWPQVEKGRVAAGSSERRGGGSRAACSWDVLKSHSRTRSGCPHGSRLRTRRSDKARRSHGPVHRVASIATKTPHCSIAHPE